MNISSPGFLARPLTFRYNDLDTHAMAKWKAEVLVRRCAAHEAFFSDYTRGCSGECSGLCRDLTKRCNITKRLVVATLGKPDTLLWEVWSTDASGAEVDFVGILRLSDYVAGCSAKAHYFFFDGQLRNKTELLQAWKRLVFDELKVHRVTIEVPAYAKALAKHAMTKLGFGGAFKVDGGLQVEGVLKDAIKWRGEWHDLYIMGCLDG